MSLPSHAQESPNPVLAPEERLSRKEISIWGGGAFAHPHLIDVVKLQFGALDLQPQSGRRLDLLGMRFDKRLWSPGKVSLRGNYGVTPLAVFSQRIVTSRRYTYGGGISTGLELTTKNSWRVQPYGDAGIGCLIFTQPTPVAEARRFNFEFYFGPGIRIPRYRIRFGVWYHHFSNKNTAQLNPGLDSLIVSVGYTFFRRGR